MLHPPQICQSHASRIIPITFMAMLVLSVSLFAAVATRAQTATPTTQPTEKVARTYPESAPADPFKARLIPRNSKIYIAPIVSEDQNKPQAQGFESYLAAALRKKDVPLLIVADASQADFIIEGTADQKGAGWAKKIILADFRKSTSASMTVTNLRTGVVAYADSSDRSSANRGLRSSAEKLAKYLKKKMEDDEKKH
ncbi:MAG TPA: hypothetical protein VGO56_07400 [Pyrinomonadaceae bacterium]|jgi:hypothetical protein|nr:hypothetical protein [Pyrinomonadaceae bacterium]